MATVLDATPNGAAANSYLTMEEADERLNEFPNRLKWDELDPDDRKVLLFQGTRLIDRYRSTPPREKETQRLAFPTSKDAAGVIPEAVKLALLEFVDMMLGNVEIQELKQLQAEGVTNSSVLGRSATFTEDRSQLPAGARNELDRLLASYVTIELQNRPYDGSGDPCGHSIFG